MCGILVVRGGGGRRFQKWPTFPYGAIPRAQLISTRPNRRDVIWIKTDGKTVAYSDGTGHIARHGLQPMASGLARPSRAKEQDKQS
ncbi:hypothetical protein AUQ43_15260 [Thalassospira sp. MCCC 1A01148]|uniref:Uncharacterized protein n=1 Tax=Thalassospira profundimaris TaxID=502049 RepID=A0A367VF20_9PROT|nr:hypothetical protein AUQ43_15260 [Thalassospira sp. MCCC 1A01148]RCK23091.1 hypothetical protein TH6_08630 [Thalassospira profundimaris]